MDLGCGRGEWLTLLRSNGIPARGFDSNAVTVAECRSLDLDVSEGDLLTILREMSPASLGAITMFQVLEHLPFQDMVEVLRLARQALKPGGVFIAEIPNLSTLFVGASTFWIDPTHPRPLHPALVKFLAAQVGFVSVEELSSTRLSPELQFDHETAETNALKYLQSILLGPADCAIIAKA